MADAGTYPHTALHWWRLTYLPVRIDGAPRRLFCHQRAYLLPPPQSQNSIPECHQYNKKSLALPCINPRPADTVLTVPNTGTSTNGSSGFGRSANNSSGKTQRADDDDLELAEMPAKVRLASEKDLATDMEIWEVDGHHSQEFLKVN